MENEAREALIQSGRKTIQKEAQALASFVDLLDERFAKACELIFDCKGTVLLTGMGKSGLVARKWSATFSGTGTKSYFVNPAEASHGDLGLVRSGDLLIALSFSGETEELGYLLRYARENGVSNIGVTGNIKSSLARQAMLTLPVQISEEACSLGLAPTTSTTLMMALGDALAVTLMQMRGFSNEDFARLHPGGSLGRKLWLRVEELMHSGDSIPRVEPKADFERVLLQMTSKRLGLAVVVEGESILGLITDGDLRRYFQSHPTSHGACAEEIMTRHPKTISHKALAVEARELMEKNSIHHLLICEDGGKLVGVLHMHDLLKARVV